MSAAPASGPSDVLKAEANAKFKDGKYEEAIALYTQAIEVFPTSVLYANRAFANLKLENYGAALLDADEAITLDPFNVKAHYRHGTANIALGKVRDARQDFEEALKIEPGNRETRDKLEEVKKHEKQQKAEAFLRAMRRDDEPSASQQEGSLDPLSIAVEASYTGPRLPDSGDVSAEFVKELMEHLRSEKKLHKRYALQIVRRATEIFTRECTVVDVTIPEGCEITVYGDVHGQYYDLLNTFDFNGVPSATNPVIFNGDFVDRGSFSVEIILVLLALKCCQPKSVFLNRGNHETENMNKIYGFEGEVKAKLGMEYMRPFADCFRAMPLSCVIDTKILVLHGGLFSQDGVTLDMMRKVNRFMEPPDAGIMTDMLWSDPQRAPGRSPSKRGVGIQFGPDVTKRFLDANNLKMLIRSHECKDRGYEVRASPPLSSLRSCVAVQPHSCSTCRSPRM
jgi:serine/threonine-protein phosphatase 5